jgi:hypothetical protein
VHKCRCLLRGADIWVVTDGSEYVARYNPVGHTMSFTDDPAEAFHTTDSKYAYDVARIACDLYRRKHMRIQLLDE